jgi:hypothetical protein
MFLTKEAAYHTNNQDEKELQKVPNTPIITSSQNIWLEYESSSLL